MSDSYAEWDAAYVLGALEPGERRDFEAHLATCERCRASVAELASMPGLLTRAQPWFEETSGEVGPPSNLVSLVEAREARRRSKARRRVGFIAVGAAAVLALGIGIPLALTPAPPAPDAVVAMEAVASTPITASLTFDSVAWGTNISMTCDYPASAYPGTGGGTYSLVVTSTSGDTQSVGTWDAVPGKTIHLNAATSVPLDEIATVTMVDSSGTVLLSAPVTA
ncbi:MAG: zf-HC2 domain-containing protein [Demequina sp.]|jgi:anti-sigma factor RsiW|nr:zf-HC2 domain-containing protein [Demequina sp.]